MRTTVLAALAASALAATISDDSMSVVTSTGEDDASPIGMAEVTKDELDTYAEGANGGRQTPMKVKNFGLGTAPLTDGISLWTDVIEAEVVDTPEWMNHQLDMIVKSSSTDTTNPFFFQCFPKTGEVCDLYALAYPCVDCPDYEHGDFIKSLVADGWEVFKCTPSVAYKGSVHKMLGLRKTVEKESKIFKFLDKPSELFSFGIDYKPEVCDSIAMEDKCNTMTKGKCIWDNGECVFNTCKPGGLYGPGFCTTHCLTGDLPWKKNFA